MELQLPIAAITDEFSQDLEVALEHMAKIGMTGAELRMVFGKNIIDLSDEEVDRATRLVHDKGLRVISIASPLLKCVLPDGPPVDERFHKDMFGAQYNYEDQPRLAERALEIAKRSGARIIRVFSFWRTVEPEKVQDRVIEELAQLAEKARRHDLIIGLENEHACNIATGAETAKVIAALDHPHLGIVWDPANAYVAGERSFPDGYQKLPKNRIIHVHAKDCKLRNHTPVWGPLGLMDLDWKGQVSALLADGYRNYISLETHWPGPNNDKLLASIICGENLKALVSA